MQRINAGRENGIRTIVDDDCGAECLSAPERIADDDIDSGSVGYNARKVHVEA